MAGTHFGGRTLARSQALQLLFQAEATKRLVSDVLEGDYALDEGPLDEYAERLALGADGMRHELDALMAATSDNWGVSRMPAVDRNLLRIALYEMLMVDEVDVPVAIDECVDLARAYGTDDSYRFVNGLLGRVAQRLEAGEDVLALASELLAAEEAKAEEAEAVEAEQAEVAEEPAADDDAVETDADAEAEDLADPDDGELPDWARE